MLRALPALIEIGLLIYALIDCIQTPDKAVRNLPRWAWLLLIVLLPYVGPIAWLVAGRPQRSGAARPGGIWPSGGPGGPRGYGGPGGYGGAPGRGGSGPARPVIGPDDDPDFLRGLNRPADDKDDPPG
jgi:Phospholipase_D-nuclease N-terminal